MKTIPFATISSTVLAIAALALPQALAQSANPTGELTASPSLVPAGTRPSLTWSVTYPVSVMDYVTIKIPGGITPKQNLLCDVRIIGASVTTQDAKGKTVYLETLGQLLYNGSSTWEKIFDGTNTDPRIQTQAIVKSFTATANQPINFGGYSIYKVKSFTYTSLVGDNVRFLVNGDAPPSNMPGCNDVNLNSFIKPYLDASGKVKIGPMEVIVFMELTTNNKATSGYDLQDLVFLVTFNKIPLPTP